MQLTDMKIHKRLMKENSQIVLFKLNDILYTNKPKKNSSWEKIYLII